MQRLVAWDPACLPLPPPPPAFKSMEVANFYYEADCLAAAYGGKAAPAAPPAARPGPRPPAGELGSIGEHERAIDFSPYLEPLGAPQAPAPTTASDTFEAAPPAPAPAPASSGQHHDFLSDLFSDDYGGKNCKKAAEYGYVSLGRLGAAKGALHPGCFAPLHPPPPPPPPPAELKAEPGFEPADCKRKEVRKLGARALRARPSRWPPAQPDAEPRRSGSLAGRARGGGGSRPCGGLGAARRREPRGGQARRPLAAPGLGPPGVEHHPHLQKIGNISEEPLLFPGTPRTMVSCVMESLSVLGSLLLLGLQLVCPQPSTEHRKVPQRMAVAEGAPEDGGGGAPGVWGSWGPWSACSRSCSGGVMEQTRPCLPSSYRTRGGPRPGAPARAFAGHVVSAVRTSVPLHRSREETRAPAGLNSSRQGPALRGSRHPQARGREPTAERRSRTRGPIGPGKYGYGKAPYILPLQTDSAHPPQRLRRQRPSSRNSRSQGASGSSHGYHPSAHQPHQHGPLYQSESGPRSGLQASEGSVYQLPLTHDQGFPAASSLFHSPEASSSPGLGAPRAAQSFSQPTRSTAISCIGAYRQYKLCNTNVCPESSRSIWEVQCASYNNKPFMGRFYEWEPFAEVKGNRKCELNCQAMGYRFYVRQAEKVIDGTPCDQNGTAICVSGQCKSIGCDDYLGSDKVVDKCGVCGGDNTGCQVVSGVFKHALTSLGYHRVVEIPQGATKINITEMHKSNNYLALRSRSGRSIINGNWAIDRPGKYEGGGTMFTYKRPNEISSTAGESFLAEGPTNEILDVYMIHQQPNPGVHYEYVIMGNNAISPQVPPHRRPGEPFNGQLVPEGRSQQDGKEKEGDQEKADERGGAPEMFTLESAQTFPVRQPDRFSLHRPDSVVPPAPQPPRQSRDHNWKQLGTTECSTTCGKGSQYPIFRCVNRNTHEEVPESYCDLTMKPTPEEEPCNIFPCPAFWDIGEWSECSKTCGLGMQHRQVLCRQVYANRSLTVQPYRCQHLEKPETTSTCQLKICSEWQIRTDWTSCSVPCGVGQRTRDVKCVSNIGDVVDDEECNMKLRPNDIENCDMGPCAKSWFLTEWSERCSAECGAGVRTRSVVCMTNHVSSLPLEGCGSNRPAEATPCDNGPCTGKVEWFAGSWSQCSVECGSGTQQREVICVRKNTDTFEVLDPYECSFLEKPPSQQPCHLKPCGAKWFHTEWSMCSKTCQGGFRVREVRCLADDMTLSNLCDPQLKPEEKESCNPQDCVPEVDENCKDRYYNCNVVVQARLCVYNYYKTACCASCTRVANRHSGFPGSR